MARSDAPVRTLHALQRSRFLILLVTLLGLFGLQPLLPTRGEESIGLELAISAVLLASIGSLGRGRNVAALAILLVLPAIAAAWLAHATSSRSLLLAGLGCALVFLSVTAATALWIITRTQDVTTETILGGICVYFLLALIWALLYSLIERLQPGSFGPWTTMTPDPSASHRLVPPDLLYYSVFTLSTVGPQTLEPKSDAARAWTGLEAMIGQLYLAVLIARLVGLHAASRGSSRD